MKTILTTLFLSLALAAPSAHAAGARIDVLGPTTVAAGQTFRITARLQGGVDVDTFRLKGVFDPARFEWMGASLAGPFPNVSPGTSVDEATGAFSYGGFTFDAFANGTANLAVITLKARSAGTGSVALGAGTDAYSNGEPENAVPGRLRITVTGEKPLEAPTIVKKLQIIGPSPTTALLLSSSSHPDPNAWYTDPNVVVRWETTKPVDKMFIGFDASPETQAYEPTSQTSATFIAPRDGTWYVHLSIAFADKTYGRIDFPVRIDRTPPHPVVPVADQTNVAPDVTNFVRFGTTDDASGIASYEVRMDGKLVTSTQDTSYPLQGLALGTHTIHVTATDFAGNKVGGQTDFTLVAGGVAVSFFGRLFSGLRKAYSAPLMQAISLLVLIIIVIGGFVLWITQRKRSKKAKKNG